MATEIHIIENSNLEATEEALKKLQTLGQTKKHDGRAGFPALPPPQAQIRTILILPRDYASRDELLNYRAEHPSVSVLCLEHGSALEESAELLLAALSETRSTGVKYFLKKGSKIYSESFFQAAGVGSKLDPFYQLAKRSLNPALAISAWSTLNSLLYFSFQCLPSQGEAGTGERVDVQLGADEGCVAVSVRVDKKIVSTEELYSSKVFDLAKEAANYFEIRNIPEGGKVEMALVFFKDGEGRARIDLRNDGTAAALEQKDEAKDYHFLPLGKLGGGATEEKRVVKGFKKKFSEQVAKISADPKPENFTENLVSGHAESPEQKLVISGGSGKDTAKAAVKTDALPPREKSNELLYSKIESLQAALTQREELVAKLNKEIEEIKDPMKMGVISGIKDSQAEGLKANIKRLEAELSEASAREKELMSVVDKAIQLKDDAIKKYKEVEAKLRQSSGGNNSKVIQLEKQLEEAKRQQKEMSKRITQLLEQQGGKKAA